jgi:hypothetical protein
MSEGDLVRETNDRGVWIVLSGVRYLFPSPDAFVAAGFSWDDIREVLPGVLFSVPTAPVNGTLIEERRSGCLFRVYFGSRFAVRGATFQVHGLGGGGRQFVPDGCLVAIPEAGVYRRPLEGRVGHFVVRIRTRAHVHREQLAAYLSGFVTGLASGVVLWIATKLLGM